MTPRIPPAWEIEEVERMRRVRDREDREILRIPVVEHIRPVSVGIVPSGSDGPVVVDRIS